MPAGDTAILNALSYLAVGRETTMGTYSTCTAGIDFLSCSFKTQQDTKILEQIERSRTYSKSFQLGKVVGGDLDFYFRALDTAPMYLLQNAFGGTVTTSTIASETIGGGGLQHIFSTGNMDQSWPSLCLNMRKGPVTTGRIFQYSGVRVNEMRISAALDEPAKIGFSLIGLDSTQLTNDIESVLTTTANVLLSFTNARFSVEGTFASLTSTSFWHAQSVDFSLNNHLKDGTESRRIGTNLLSVLPPGIQSYELSVNMRFNTTTAFDAMIAGTEYGAELEFLGPTITGSVGRQTLLIEFQKIVVKDAGDPEISGPDGILTSQVTFAVLRDESATGYAVRGTVINNLAAIS